MAAWRSSLLLAAGSVLFVCGDVRGDVQLSSMFSDHMVVQREVEIPVAGVVDAAAKVEAFVDGNRVATADADAAGVFRLKLPAMREAGPYRIEVRSGNDVATLNDVLAGEVWLCSGQSNMEWTLSKVTNGPQEVAQANEPRIRLYRMPRVAADAPSPRIDAKWEVCTPESAANFSGVGFFFGRHLSKELNVPVGLIQSAWGGTPAESWTPLAKLKTLTDLPKASAMAANVDASRLPDAEERFNTALVEWMKTTDHVDPGISDEAKAWANPSLDTADWRPMTMPTDVTMHGVPRGSITWYRKTIDVPANQAGRDLVLALGMIDNFDTTFFNGERVGATDHTTPKWWSLERRYVVPGALVKAGANVIAIRNAALDGPAGLRAMNIRAIPAKPSPSTATTAPAGISLNGVWQHRVERPRSASSAASPPRPLPPYKLDSAWTPGALYNAMIAPIGDFPMRGVTWYQGESNAARAAEYQAVLSGLIEAWREQFKSDVAFYIVGLANFRAATDDPNMPSDWAIVREAQRQVGRKVKNAAMAVAIDIGMANDIHPTNKQDVGKRLALIALADTYGKQLVSRGPTLKSATFEEGRVVLSFDHVGGGLDLRSDAPSFSVAGEDGKFQWAEAGVEGDRIVVTARGVLTPTKVRYAFADNPPATLFNKEGLPAEPFTAEK